MLQYTESDAGKRRLEIELGDDVKGFEEKILSSGNCGALLPCVVLRQGGARVLSYDTTGCVPFASHAPAGLDGTLDVLYQTALAALEAEDYMLTAEKVSLTEETIYVDSKTGEVRLVYGLPPAGPFRGRFEALLGRVGSWGHVTGMGAAAAQISQRIANENPDIRGMLRIIETVRKEWNIIQPIMK
jgi:hypothetical protein